MRDDDMGRIQEQLPVSISNFSTYFGKLRDRRLYICNGMGQKDAGEAHDNLRTMPAGQVLRMGGGQI